jgi:hypothetical protein
MSLLVLFVLFICLAQGEAFKLIGIGRSSLHPRFSSIPPTNALYRGPYSNVILNAGWGNYKSDGKREGTILFAIVLLAVVRGAFIPKDLRTTTSCPTGYGAEKTLAKFQQNDSSYHCLPTGELVYKYFTSRWVFPGDPEFDTNFLRIEMRGVKQGGVSFSGKTVE